MREVKVSVSETCAGRSWSGGICLQYNPGLWTAETPGPAASLALVLTVNSGTRKRMREVRKGGLQHVNNYSVILGFKFSKGNYCPKILMCTVAFMGPLNKLSCSVTYIYIF